MRSFCAVIVALVLAAASYAQKAVSFPTADGGVVSADSYGAGEHGVVLAHGGRFNKGSWEKQAQALEAAGFRVHYNFCPIHQTLRVTPAMEASISDHVWSIEEIVSCWTIASQLAPET